MVGGSPDFAGRLHGFDPEKAEAFIVGGAMSDEGPQGVAAGDVPATLGSTLDADKWRRRVLDYLGMSASDLDLL